MERKQPTLTAADLAAGSQQQFVRTLKAASSCSISPRLRGGFRASRRIPYPGSLPVRARKLWRRMFTIKSGAFERCVFTLGQVLAVLNDYTDPIPERARVEVHSQAGRVPLAFTQRCQGKIGLHLPGNPKDVLEDLLHTELAQCAWPTGEVKQPWEMPRLNWEGLLSLHSLASGEFPGLDPELLTKAVVEPGWQEHLGSVEYWLRLRFKQRAGYPHRGPELPWCGTNERHELHVAGALADGKEVPQEVLEDYPSFVDPRWANLLLKRPEFRGRLTPDQLSALGIVIRGSALDVDTVEVEPLISHVHACGPRPTHVQVDDSLYAAGLLSPLEVRVAVPTDLAGCSQFVIDTRREVTERRLQEAEDYDTREHSLGRISQRELDRRRGNRAQEFLSAPIGLAKSLEEAIQSKNIAFLLDLLDQADGHNVGSKAAVEQHFGIRLKGVPAAARRRNIFQLAGFHAEAQKVYEAQQMQALDERKAAKDVERLIQRVSSVNYRLEDGSIVTGKEYVETLVTKERGIGIVDEPRGASRRYYMRFEGTQFVKQLREKDGTLAYARLLLAQAAAITADSQIMGATL